MSRQRINVLKAVGWLTLGLGIGSGGTLVLQQWIATSTPTLEARAEQTPEKPALTTELLLEGEPSLGSSKAPLTIVEFSDFECPYCRVFHEQVLPRSNGSTSTRTGALHPQGSTAAVPRPGQAAAAAARCAGEQNRYWDLYSALFDQQTCLECKGVVGIAEALNLDISALRPACSGRQPKPHHNQSF